MVTGEKVAAAWFDTAIKDSLRWVRTKGRFYNDGQCKEIEELSQEGPGVYMVIG